MHLSIFTIPWHLPAMKHKKTVAYIFQWMPLVMWRKNWYLSSFVILGVICRLGIEVHFFVYIGKWKDTGRV